VALKTGYGSVAEVRMAGAPERGTGAIAVAIVLLLTVAGVSTSGKLSRDDAGHLISALERPDDKSSLRAVVNALTRDNHCDQVGPTLADALPPLDAGIPVRLQFIIATVPDPIDSRLGHTFDRNLDVLQRSLSASKYNLDRFWLPWTHDLAHAQNEDDVCRTETPGILVFRYGSGSATRFIAVLLVGEAPTFGVQRKQLRNALDFVWSRSHEPVIHLIAPNFSGSSQSLQWTLSAWHGDGGTRDGPRYEIISGSATADSNLALLSGERMAFAATTAPDSVLRSALYDDFLCERLGATTGEVAILTESTVYGQTFATDGGATDDGLCGGFSPRYVLPFPLHISQLRRAYDQEQAQAPDGMRQQVVSPSRPETSGDTKDVVALVSGLSSVYDDISLAKTLGTICSERIRYVGIVTTDVRDRIFLAERIHDYCPDVRLFSFDTDARLGDPSLGRVLDGMLLAGSYPLTEENQRVTPPYEIPEFRLQFQNGTGEGLFNATTATLFRLGVDAGTPFYEYASPLQDSDLGEFTQPPAWVSVVYAGGLHPVAFYESPGDGGYVLKDCRARASRSDCKGPGLFHTHRESTGSVTPHIPASWSLLEIVGLVVLVLIAAAVFADRKKAQLRAPSRAGSRAGSVLRATLVLASLAMLDLHSFPLLVLGALRAHGSLRLGPPDGWVIALMLVVLTANAFVPLAAFREKQDLGRHALLWFLLLLALALWSLHLLKPKTPGDLGHLIVLFDRSMTRGSPLRILLALGGVGWLLLLVNLTAYRHLEDLRERWPARPVAPRLGGVPWPWRVIAITVIVFTAMAAWRIQTIEPRWFTDLVAFGFLLATAAVVCGALQLLAIWCMTRAILGGFHSAGVAAAFTSTYETDPAIRTAILRRVFTGNTGYVWTAFKDGVPSAKLRDARDFLQGTQASRPGERALVAASVEALADCIAMARSVALFAMLGGVILVGAIDLYPVEPHRLLHLACWAVGVFALVAAARVLLEVNSDPTLVVVTGSKKGLVAFQWSIALRVAPLVALLLYQLFSSHFPLEVGRYSRLFDALTRTLK
jgi:hypothetical protein